MRRYIDRRCDKKSNCISVLYWLLSLSTSFCGFRLRSLKLGSVLNYRVSSSNHPLLQGLKLGSLPPVPPLCVIDRQYLYSRVSPCPMFLEMAITRSGPCEPCGLFRPPKGGAVIGNSKNLKPARPVWQPSIPSRASTTAGSFGVAELSPYCCG